VAFAALPACAGGFDPGLRAGASEPVAARDVEGAIESLIREWFALLAAAPADPRLLARLVREPSFEVSLDERRARAPEELGAWLAELRSPQGDVAFAIDSIRIVPEPEGRYRAHFEVERRTRAADGSLRLRRWHQSWWLRPAPGAAPSVLRIEQRPALPFPGTGPRIVCD